MSTTLVLAAALLAQGATEFTVPAPTADRIDVAFEEIMAGQAELAIEKIKQGGAARDGDPSALINLGTANAMLGRQSLAQNLYRAAIISDMRYNVQLSDGTWLDSRRAARLAIAKLAKGEALALK